MEIQKCYGTFNTGSIMEDMSANKYMEACKLDFLIIILFNIIYSLF